jgi:hypothetical protein
MVCGLATEAWSRPQRNVIVKMFKSKINADSRDDKKNALFEIYQDRWEGDFADGNNNNNEAEKQSYNYNWNFVRRMLPHVFGYIPMAGAWVMIIKLVSLFDLNILTSS